MFVEASILDFGFSPRRIVFVLAPTDIVRVEPDAVGPRSVEVVGPLEVGPFVVLECQVVVDDIIGKITVLVFSGYMLVEGIRFLEISSINRMTGINISLTWLFISVPVAAAAWIIALIDNFKRMFSNDTD